MTPGQVRGRRPVRPRPPSAGRPRVLPARLQVGHAPDFVHHRPIKQGRGLPWPAQLLLAAAVLLLGATVLLVGSGQLGRIADGLVGSLSSLTAQISAPPTASPTLIPLLDAPVLISSTPYTNQPTVDLSGTLPTDVTGQAGYRVRIYRMLGGLVLQVVTATAGLGGLGLCSACGQQYVPTRRPVAGKRHYCESCRKKPAQRDASAAYRQRERAKRA